MKGDGRKQKRGGKRNRNSASRDGAESCLQHPKRSSERRAPGAQRMVPRASPRRGGSCRGRVQEAVGGGAGRLKEVRAPWYRGFQRPEGQAGVENQGPGRGKKLRKEQRRESLLARNSQGKWRSGWRVT